MRKKLTSSSQHSTLHIVYAVKGLPKKKPDLFFINWVVRKMPFSPMFSFNLNIYSGGTFLNHDIIV